MDNTDFPAYRFSVQQALALVAAVVGMLVSQGIIDNQREKLITGLAAIILPAVWMIADAVIRWAHLKAHARVITAKIAYRNAGTTVNSPRV
jgi:hypothetical protein